MIKGLGPPARGQKENGGFSYKSFAQASTVILMELDLLAVNSSRTDYTFYKNLKIMSGRV